MEFPSLQSSTARKAAVGVVAGDLVIGIAEQTGAANRGYANIVAANHGAAHRYNRSSAIGVDIDLAEIDRLPDRVTFSRCPYCSTVHGWRPKDTWVSEERPAGRRKQ